MSAQKLRQILSRKQNEVGLVGGKVNVEEYDEMEHDIEAYIEPQGWNTTVKIRKGFNPVQDRRQKAYARKKGIENGLETLVTHVGALHEPAHWELPVNSGKGCPFDIYYHDKILEAVKSALPEDKKGHASYLANVFEDTIINPRCREFNGDYSGQVLFWDNEGNRVNKKQGQKGFTPVYEAFVKLNMHLWGDNVDRALLKRHYRNNLEVDSAVEKIVDGLHLPENIQDTSILFKKDKWSSMARLFTKHLVPLLDEAPTERPSAYSQNGQGSGQGEEQQAGNGIEKKMGTQDGREEVAFGRYASNDKHSPNFTDFQQLDSLYRRMARAIPVNVEAMTREQGVKIAPLNYRSFDEETDDVSAIKPTKLIISENGLTFGVPKQPLTVIARSKMQKKSFPNFKMVMLDNSGSMREAVDGSGNVGNTNFIPWGDRSKYHFGLLGFYGVENFLQKQGIAQYINHGLALFSSNTRYKEAGFSGIDEVRKHALCPDWGGTNIDSGVLRKALEGKQSFVLSISDGEIGDWSSERESVRKLFENNYFAHVQIGSGTTFTNDLESWGKPVFYVNSGDDLSRLMVDVTKDTYRRFTRE